MDGAAGVSEPPGYRYLFQVYWCNGHTVLGRYGSVVFSIARGKRDPDGIEASWQLMTAMRNTYPEGFCVLNITERSAEPADSATRRRVLEMTQEFAEVIRAHALVLEGDGVWYSALRTMMSAMTAAIQGPTRTRISQSTQEAIVWLHRACDGDARFDEPGLALALAEARSQLYA